MARSLFRFTYVRHGSIIDGSWCAFDLALLALRPPSRRAMRRLDGLLAERKFYTGDSTMAEKAKGLSIDEIKAETKRLASDLAFKARAPVTIQLVGGQHIAFTYATDESKKQHHIPIVMNPDTLKKVRNKEQALKIWRGIGIHELLHHLFPAESQYKAAYKEGFKDLFNLVDDEQNERMGRAMDVEWGACLQAVCAHVFPSKKKNDEQLNIGIIDGEPAKNGRKPRGIAAHNVYAKRWNLFAYHFRRHIPGCTDPVVAEALNLIPTRFIDLDKAELFELTKRIHLTLAKGLELPNLPEPTEPEEEEEEKKKEDPKAPQPSAGGEAEEDKDKKDDDKEDAPELPPDRGWSLKRILTSKWMILPFGLFIAIWTMLLLRGGIDFWVQVAVFGGIALIALIAFLFARRAFIKMLLAQIKARTLGPPGAPTPVGKAFSTKNARIAILIVVLAIVGFLLWKLLLWLGMTVLLCAAQFILLIGACAVANHFSKSESRKNKPVSKWMSGLLVVIVIASTAGMGFTMHKLGLGILIIAPVVSILLLGGLIALAMWLPGKKEGANGEAGGYRREKLSVRIKRLLKEMCLNALHAIGRGFARFFKWIGGLLASIGIFIWRIAVWVWKRIIVPTAQFIAYWCVRAYWKMEPWLTRLWRNSFFRLAVVALPVAAIIVIMYAVLYTAGKINIWLMIALIVLLLLLLLLLFLFRKKIKKFIITELFMPMPSLMDLSMQVPLDMETEWFVQIDNVQPVEPDQAVLDELQPLVHALAQQLRPYFQKCGRITIDRDDQPEGYDLVDEAELALVGESQIFVDDDTAPKPSVHLEVALDCSSSMASATATLKPGEKFKLGKFFALVLEQATLNLPGVSAHFWGFTNNVIYDCGVPGEGRSSGLVCGGGNNDSAMLWHMGQSAAKSGKHVKILLMLSDGQPSECSWLSLHNLVLQFEQEGMIPWNFALDVIQIPAFKRFFTDLVGQTMDEAIVTMGETLAAIAQEYS